MVLAILLLLCISRAVVSQPFNCREVTVNELGNTTAHSTDGIVANSVRAAGDSGAAPAVLIYDHRVTCSVAGTVPGTFHYLSAVVTLNCADQPGSSALPCANSLSLGGEGDFTLQIELACSAGPQWVRGDDVGNLVGSTTTVPADGSLTTERDFQCGLCFSHVRRDARLNSSAVYDTESHCVRKLHVFLTVVIVFI